jgi:hypothetical protein
MARKREAQVDTPSSAHSIMSSRWDIINSLLGGTQAMRAAGEALMPRHVEEAHDNWQRRLMRSVLTNIFKRTIRSLSGRPFTEEIQLIDVPDELEEFSKDVDKLGNDINVFAREVFQDGMAKGHTLIQVEFPPVAEFNEDGSARTLADEIREGVSPYFIHIRPENVIAAFAEIIGGVEMLTHVRIREDTVERDGMFDERFIERIRVHEPGQWWLWEKIKVNNRKEEWKIVDSGETSLPFIPIVVFYTNRLGLMLSDPPLTDIANLNVAHWQSSSDQRHILTVARFPILASSGVVDLGTTAIGPNEHLNTPDTQGRFYYVEHSGAAIGAGRQDLEDLKEEMVTLAMEPLLRKAGNVTATQRSIDAAEGHSELQNLAMKFGEFLTTAYIMASMWVGVEWPKGSKVEVYTEFGPTAQESADIDQLIMMRGQQDISRISFYKELMRRNFLDINFDAEAEEALIEDEVPAMGMLQLAVDNDGKEGPKQQNPRTQNDNGQQDGNKGQPPRKV